MLEGNPFKAPFIAQLPISTSEPNIPEAAEIKNVLLEEIEAAWVGKDPIKALDDAADRVNLILNQ
jgi:maltose-binding protein MalE